MHKNYNDLISTIDLRAHESYRLAEELKQSFSYLEAESRRRDVWFKERCAVVVEPLK